VRINVLDGVRVYFHDGDVAHVRPSGNAPQLRIYANSDSQARR
jgi:phosphomannomutase